ncbi:hypothetical protein [Streptomyces sp. NBC_00162]|uniref:hypothetical protein n=1 Tax=Streptomyces sp. NBC_00162 TaxID=2903629 RepID=UPI00214BC9F7|nr:hypothetical protein [Streptomyces sp. NBC_00162]UUU37506.1 hypothetical protein JIW86_00305 [Streptomyces sp. NBC_00162]
MDATEPGARPVELPVESWLVIDSAMGAETSVEGQTGDEAGVVELGLSVRRAGWNALPDWPSDPQGFTSWPQPGRRVTIALSASQWSLVLAVLDRWAEVGDSLDDPKQAEEAQRCRALAEHLRSELDSTP